MAPTSIPDPLPPPVRATFLTSSRRACTSSSSVRLLQPARTQANARPPPPRPTPPPRMKPCASDHHEHPSHPRPLAWRTPAAVGPSRACLPARSSLLVFPPTSSIVLPALPCLLAASARPVHTPSLAIGARANKTALSFPSPRPRLLPTAQFRAPYSDTPLKRRLHYTGYHPNQPQLQIKRNHSHSIHTCLHHILVVFVDGTTAIYRRFKSWASKEIKVVLILVGFGW